MVQHAAMMISNEDLDAAARRLAERAAKTGVRPSLLRRLPALKSVEAAEKAATEIAASV